MDAADAEVGVEVSASGEYILLGWNSGTRRGEPVQLRGGDVGVEVGRVPDDMEGRRHVGELIECEAFAIACRPGNRADAEDVADAVEREEMLELLAVGCEPLDILLNRTLDLEVGEFVEDYDLRMHELLLDGPVGSFEDSRQGEFVFTVGPRTDCGGDREIILIRACGDGVALMDETDGAELNVGILRGVVEFRYGDGESCALSNPTRGDFSDDCAEMNCLGELLRSVGFIGLAAGSRGSHRESDCESSEKIIMFHMSRSGSLRYRLYS